MIKKLTGTRLLIITVVVLALVVITGSVAFAAGAFNKEVPATASIKATTPGLTLYQEMGAINEITTVAFGDVASGGSAVKYAYLKNTGNKDFTNITAASNLDPAIGEITVTGLNPLARGDGYNVTITLNTLESANDINPNIVITLSGTY